ncbi:hypothetical protein [Paenibacillus harenae]|uniref:Uncharacterized protein n=1 Tax=Paenibacillus harenae TaxID=306543 RepID=A0ABT9U4R6_PAEHA|nr:hypothetical protein [Paenibacillus harenae]MDQ0062437.1 hypothetical protein [Paenibacillus harenae]MDQ0114637.1 hypothetical protein [Paenibacillus harenae]
MSQSIYGEIIAGHCIGKFVLGLTKNELLELIDFPYNMKETPDSINVESENIDFFIDKHTGKLFTISVFGDFRGKFQNQIRIGSTLTDVKKQVKGDLEYDPMGNEYNMKGITFFFSPMDKEKKEILNCIVIWKSFSVE